MEPLIWVLEASQQQFASVAHNTIAESCIFSLFHELAPPTFSSRVSHQKKREVVKEEEEVIVLGALVWWSAEPKQKLAASG